MVNTIFSKIALNEMPNLTMEEITRNLFNCDFLSDVQFRFTKGNIIYCHTWELKKRSVVFQKQFASPVKDVLEIPITDTSYSVFYEFIRFIYTDDCDINQNNRIDLLKLAIKYKIIRLETKLINGLNDCLDAFEFCILENYDFIFNMVREWIENDLHSLSNSSRLQTLHPNVLEAILKLDYLQGFNEVLLFEFLMRWMNYTCEQNKIPSTERRTRFDKFIRLIRFPTMTIDEFTTCVNKNIDLFTKQDIMNILREISIGTPCPDTSWNSKKRLNSIEPHRLIHVANRWETKFTVLNNITLQGLRFGFCNYRSNFTIRITGHDINSKLSETLIFKFDKSLCTDSEMVVNLGESIELKTNHEYTIEIEAYNGLQIPSLRNDRRPKIQDVILNLNQPQIIHKLKESPNLLGTIYKLRDII